MCCCDKILVNVAAYVIPGWVCTVRSKQEPEVGIFSETCRSNLI